MGWLVLYQMGKITGGHGEETFDVENTIEESDELDWMKGPPSFRFGEISRDLRNYFSKGDKVYLTGILHLSEGNEDITLHLNNEPAVVKLVRVNSGVLDLILGENITSLPIWLSAMGDSDLDLGNFNEDDDIMITAPYKNINESDLDWIRDVQPNQKVKPWNGNIGYPTTDKTSPTYGKVYLYTDDEGVTREIKVGGLTSKHRTKNYKGEWFGSDGEVSFYDASIMSSDIESKNYDPYYPDPFEGKYRITMSRQEYNDNARKGKLTLTPNNNSITESEEDFTWASGFEWSKEMLGSMLTDCKPLRVANFNIKNKQPYTSAGGPSIMFLSRCKEWWNYFNQQPLTDSGRGPAEWFTEDTYEVGDIGVIWNPRWGRNNVTPTLEDLKDEYTSAITTQWGYGIEKQLNGTGTNEAWFIVDEDNRPVYNLIPEPVKGYAKIYEEFFGDRLNESDDFDWAREIPGTKEYGQKYRYFEIVACYGIDYETEECDDEYSHHIRIPSDKVDEIWDIPFDRQTRIDVGIDYLAGPNDEGEGVIMYAITNQLIPPRELNEIVMFQGVREEDGSHFDGIDENINESDELDWIKDVEAIKSPKVSENNTYVIWLGELEGYEREQIKDWLFKNLSKCNKPPFTDLNFENKAVVTFSSIDCGVGGIKDSSYEVAKEAYQTWSKVMTPLDPQKILRGVDINESDELDWIKDTVNTKLAKNENWILVNDIDREIISEGHEIQKYLFDLGYSWGTGDLKNSLMDFCIYTIYHYGNEKNDDHMYYQDGCRDAEVRISDRDIKSGKHMIYYWSDLKPKTIKEENEFDWIKDIETKGFNKSKSYYVDVSDLKPYTPMSTSPTSEEYTKLTRADVLDKLKRLGYNIDEIPLDDADYLYIEPNDEAGYWDDTTWINQTHWVDYDMEHNTPDPTYNGKYEVMDVNDLMFLLDNKVISESNDFDWVKTTGLGKVDLRDCKPGDILITRNGRTAEYVGPSDGYYDHEIKFEKNSYGTRTHDGYVFRKNRRDNDEDIIQVLKEHKKTITETAGISFEARKWGEIIYNEIMDNPNEKKRLIIDGYDHPEAFDGFPIDYVVVDFYDRITGYGQEHSGYDKDGNYVVLLYIQPRLVQGQGGYDLKSVLNHEMKHAWEDYNRLSKGLPSIEQTKESQDLYNRDFILMLSDQNIRGPIKEILKYYYYLSDLEKSAYLENVYDQNKVYERVLRDIAGKDFNEFKDRFDLDINWHLMNTAYDIPFLKKFKSPIDFIDYSAEELRSKALKMIKKVNKMRYIHKK